MVRKNLFLILAVFTPFLLSCGDSASKTKTDIPAPDPILMPERKPNIIVIFTDDQGFADVGYHNQRSDIKTPNIDMLAQRGIQFSQGYVTAPQCTPSRAAMITGQYQQKFGLDDNSNTPMSLDVETLGQKLKAQGYKTGMFGKWHLEIDRNSKAWSAENHPDIRPYNLDQIPFDIQKNYFPDQRGYDESMYGYNTKYWSTIPKNGASAPGEYVIDNRYRLDLVTQEAVDFIDRNWEDPFYMHVAHYAPHVPLEATSKYLSRFPADMPNRRRYALAMLSAIDDGVGQIVDKLEELSLLDNTIIFFISDNGAPLGEELTDAPINDRNEAWNGSLNNPYSGEKGMLTEGGIRVPFILQWPAKIASSTIIDEPVSTLDAAYTLLKAGGISNLANLDGLDLLSIVSATERTKLNDRPLFWRFFSQRAVRLGKWKYLQAGIEREYLFDMESNELESLNLIAEHPEIATELKSLYVDWESTLFRLVEQKEISEPFKRRYDYHIPR